MINGILKMAVPAVAIMLVGQLMPQVNVESFGVAIVVAILLGLLNIFVKPILTILTIPITMLTLGLFLIVIDALLIIFTSHVVDGFQVENLFWAIIFSLFISGTGAFLNFILD